MAHFDEKTCDLYVHGHSLVVYGLYLFCVCFVIVEKGIDEQGTRSAWSQYQVCSSSFYRSFVFWQPSFVSFFSTFYPSIGNCDVLRDTTYIDMNVNSTILSRYHLAQDSFFPWQLIKEKE